METKVRDKKLSIRIFTAITEGNITNLEGALTDPLFEASILEQTNAQGISPFRLAARSASAQIVEMLIDYGADASQDMQPLFLAASWGNTPALRVLINRGNNVNLLGAGQQTPLIAAVKAGRLQAAQELILANAELNVEDSKKNTPLSIAWVNNDLEMVRCLVKYGSVVDLERWVSAPHHGANMSLHLVEGVAQFITLNPKLRFDIIPELPASSLPEWILLAPEGAAILLDSILIKEVKDSTVPERAELKSSQPMIAVSTILREFDKTQPIFETLVPRDTGRGTQVKVSVLLIKGVLTPAVIQAISMCSQPAKILTALGVKGILSVLWDFHIRSIFYVDLMLEGVNLITFCMWTGFVSEGFQSSKYTSSKLISLGLLTIVMMREVMQQSGSLAFVAEVQKESFFSLKSLKHVNVVSAVDIVASAVLILLAGIFPFTMEHANYDYLHPPTYLSVLSITAFFRWLRIIDYLCSFQSVGAKILPIVKCFSLIGAFLSVFLLILFFLLHGTYVFYFSDERFGSIIDFFMRQYFLGMVSRWPIFLQQLEKTGLYLHNPDTPRGTWVESLDKQRNPNFGFTEQCKTSIEAKTPQTEFFPANRLESEFYEVIIFWYLAGAILIGIVMLQIFVGVLSQAYANEKSRANISFAKRRSEVSCTYLVNRTIQSSGWKLVNLFRFMIGRVKIPVKDGFVWICAKSDDVDVSADDITETSKKKEQLLDQICKKLSEFALERVDRMRSLNTIVERLDEKLDYMVSLNDVIARERAHAREFDLSVARAPKSDDIDDDLSQKPKSKDLNILQAVAGGRK